SIRPHKKIRPQETAGQTLFEDGWTVEDGWASGNGQHRRCACGEELVAEESIRRGNCTRCFLTAKRADR
ncbi:MAG: hypothetical protein ACLP3C_29710, partial [Mycobacterium sp.]|uniref:hypothetical protein n=1 Tax=Mycobacterium sp. TaxID=1785 RepID=UPI003F98DDCE